MCGNNNILWIIIILIVLCGCGNGWNNCCDNNCNNCNNCC